MLTLDTLCNSTRRDKKIQRVGRGLGSGRGKTCCRGQKGDKSRSGYKRRYGKEGGQLPLFRKLPTRGFSHGRFRREVIAINLGLIDRLFVDGEIVSADTLRNKRLLSRRTVASFKILNSGTLTKKVSFDGVDFLSVAAREQLDKQGIVVKHSARQLPPTPHQ